MSTRTIPVPTHHELSHGDLVEAEVRRRLRTGFRCRYRFRSGPVPGWGRRGPYERYLRHPRTTAARRAAEAFRVDAREEDLPHDDGGLVRLRTLPHAWDDIHRTDWMDRCWKRHRAMQHRTA